MVDTMDLKFITSNGVWVRLPPSAPQKIYMQKDRGIWL